MLRKSLKESLILEALIEDLIEDGYNRDEVMDAVKYHKDRVENTEYLLTKPYEHFLGEVIHLADERHDFGEHTVISRVPYTDTCYILRRNSDEGANCLEDVQCVTNKETLAYFLSGGTNKLLRINRLRGDGYISVTI